MKKQIIFVILTLFLLQFISLVLAQEGIPSSGQNTVPAPRDQEVYQKTVIIAPWVGWFFVLILPILLSTIYFYFRRSKKSKLVLWAQSFFIWSIVSLLGFFILGIITRNLADSVLGLFLLWFFVAIPLVAGVILLIIHFFVSKN